MRPNDIVKALKNIAVKVWQEIQQQKLQQKPSLKNELNKVEPVLTNEHFGCRIINTNCLQNCRTIVCHLNTLVLISRLQYLVLAHKTHGQYNHPHTHARIGSTDHVGRPVVPLTCSSNCYKHLHPPGTTAIIVPKCSRSDSFGRFLRKSNCGLHCGFGFLTNA